MRTDRMVPEPPRKVTGPLTAAVALALICLAVGVVGFLRLRGGPAGFPTAPGTYEADGWRYTYVVEGKGTRSERRIGTLFRDGKQVTGDVGDTQETPLGRFALFPAGAYDSGWVNTRTYDRPVFDSSGDLLPGVRRLLRVR